MATGARPCFHCGEAIAGAPVIAADGAAFCCAGCEAAAAWIRDARLDDYYRLRSALPAPVGTDTVDLSVWDRDEVLAEHAHAFDGGLRITLLTDGMRCAACAWLIDRALSREDGVSEVTANAVTGRIRIAWDPARAPLSAILRRLLALGYRPYLAAGDARERERARERRRWLLRLGVAGLGAMQAMMLAEALYLDFDASMPTATRDVLRWLTFVLSTPVVFYAGWPFLIGCWRELRARHVGMDTLIATSTLLAYFASLAETIRGGPHVWYDAAVMFVFLLLAARMLEQRARSAASAQVDALARARPAFATRERADGERETVAIARLAVGDTACVAAGETVPADGRLLEGPVAFEESLLTGESSPVLRQAGETVHAGSVCRERPARVAVTGVGTATRLSQLTRLVEQAQAQRPALARAADRIGSRFVATLLVAAVAVYAGWQLYEPSRAFEVTLALLVISCPCALSLAVPTALATAHGTLARLGVLATRDGALDTLAAATDVVFDKTGTLGDARAQLERVVPEPGTRADEALAIAAALQRDSRHPLAAAFAEAPAAADAQDVRSVPGEGVEGTVGGRRWRLGQARFAAAGAPDEDVWLGDGMHPVARFVLRERVRDDAPQALDALRAQGLALHLASGDAPARVAAFAQRLGLDDAHARQSPQDKLDRVHALQAQGRVVAMVGDGLNDAPVLAGADVSIAMGEGASLAQRAADLVLTGGSLMRIPAAVAVARRTRRVIRQNLAWALGYNLVALPVAAAGLVTPWLAALGMALSSLAVTANALRLARAPSLPAPRAAGGKAAAALPAAPR
ncbi:cadmium-translocating P-type ATPase [Luteimonas sp. Y-2-2-4F]|nr:heavy metal translocating P-type ATPase [Luteimonas sp. Y-2-2-4F]MCD9033546.1 cadmium-translocating P-type ATPase [Luteimonas sp. Y-2-2-4F]